MKTTTPTKLLTGQWGAAMNYIETHKPVLINNRDHRDIVMVLATDYEEMKQKCEALEHELAQFQWVDIKERQPKKHDECLVLGSDFFEVAQAKYSPNYGDSAFYAYVEGREAIYSAAHWMPKPHQPINKL